MNTINCWYTHSKLRLCTYVMAMGFNVWMSTTAELIICQRPTHKCIQMAPNVLPNTAKEWRTVVLFLKMCYIFSDCKIKCYPFGISIVINRTIILSISNVYWLLLGRSINTCHTYLVCLWLISSSGAIGFIHMIFNTYFPERKIEKISKLRMMGWIFNIVVIQYIFALISFYQSALSIPYHKKMLRS